MLFKDVLTKTVYLDDTSWRRLEDGLKTFLQDVLKTPWKRLEEVLKTYSQDEYIGLDQDVLKTCSEDVRLRSTYSSWSRCLKDVFIKTNVCWEKTSCKQMLKTSWRRFENVLRRRLEDILKTSWRRLWKTYYKHVLKTSWKTKNYYAEHVFKTSWKSRDVCWGEAVYDKEFNASCPLAYQRLICFCFVEA